jgi:hypothetical protein
MADGDKILVGKEQGHDCALWDQDKDRYRVKDEEKRDGEDCDRKIEKVSWSGRVNI